MYKVMTCPKANKNIGLDCALTTPDKAESERVADKIRESANGKLIVAVIERK
jgi:hypothetical protein